MIEMSTAEWLTLTLAVVGFVFGIIGWLFNRLLHQHSQLAKERKLANDELQKQRDHHEATVFVHLAEKIEGLVNQITSLFSGQREIHEEFKKVYSQINKNHAEIKAENALVFAAQREQVIRCAEREKILSEVKEVQKEHIAKFGKEITNLKVHPPMRAVDVSPLACEAKFKGETE